MPYFAEGNWLTIDKFWTNLPTSKLGQIPILYFMIYISPVENLIDGQSRSSIASSFRRERCRMISGFSEDDMSLCQHDTGFNQNDSGFTPQNKKILEKTSGFSQGDSWFTKKYSRFRQNDSGFTLKDSGFTLNESRFSQNDLEFKQKDSGFDQKDR